MSIRITCIEKDSGNHENPYTAIKFLGWIDDETSERGKSTRLQMYKFVKEDHGVAYVKDTFGNKAYVIGAVTQRGTEYVKTVADDTKTDNLLKLPEC